MLNAVLWFCIGLLCLVKGGDWFVDGAVGIARRFRLPDLLIGATVVSVGTTLPEVMISARRPWAATARSPTATPSGPSSATRRWWRR